MSSEKNTEISEAINALLNKVGSVQLSTLGENSTPESSYTPYLLEEDRVYIFVSQLSSHTQNMIDRPNASFMFIEDEGDAKNIFARKRLILSCTIAPIERTNTKWDQVLTSFEKRHGNTVSLLKTLPDFVLFECSPIRGSYVQGFGQAYQFNGLAFRNAKLVTGK